MGRGGQSTVCTAAGVAVQVLAMNECFECRGRLWIASSLDSGLWTLVPDLRAPRTSRLRLETRPANLQLT